MAGRQPVRCHLAGTVEGRPDVAAGNLRLDAGVTVLAGTICYCPGLRFTTPVRGLPCCESPRAVAVSFVLHAPPTAHTRNTAVLRGRDPGAVLMEP